MIEGLTAFQGLRLKKLGFKADGLGDLGVQGHLGFENRHSKSIFLIPNY